MATQEWTPLILRKKNTTQGKRAHNPEGTKFFQRLDSDDPPPPPKVDMNLRNFVADTRMKKGWTRADLARHAQVRESDIRDIEHTVRVPPPTVLRKIMKALRPPKDSVKA